MKNKKLVVQEPQEDSPVAQHDVSNSSAPQEQHQVGENVRGQVTQVYNHGKDLERETAIGLWESVIIYFTAGTYLIHVEEDNPHEPEHKELLFSLNSSGV